MPEYDFPPQVEDVNSVPEVFRPFYVQNAEKTAYVHADTVKPLIEAYVGTSRALKDATKLKTQNGNEAAARRQTLNRIADIATTILGIDLNGKDVEKELPDLLTTHITDLATKAAGGEQIKINMDTVKAAAEKRISEIQAQAESRVGKMQGALERYLIDREATAALAAAKGSVKMLLPHVKSAVKVVQDGDDYSVVVVDEKGEARPNGKGGFMSINDLVAEMKASTDFATAFESEAKGGSDVRQRDISRMPQRPTTDLSSTDKISQGLAARQGRR